METVDNEIHSEKRCQARLNAIADALYAIGGKWKLPIIVVLMNGDRRFNELRRLVRGISARVLSAELKELELNGFVHRKVFPTTPVVVEYELSDYAHTLTAVLDSLDNWGSRHREKVKEN